MLNSTDNSINEIKPQNKRKIPLKPIEKNKNEKEDPHKRLINQMQQLNNKSASNWEVNLNKTSLEDKDFRKTVRTERLIIDCNASNDLKESKTFSVFRWDESFDEEKQYESVNRFNSLVRNQLKLEYYQVHDFLDDLNLPNYIDNFLQSGYDCLDKIKSNTKTFIISIVRR